MDRVLHGTNLPSSGPELSWFHHGDHGGQRREVQRTPMVFSWPGLEATKRAEPMRLVDVLPTILTVTEIEFDPADKDGEAIEPSVGQLR